MRKVDQQEFMEKISEVAFMIEKDKKILLDSLYRTHPASSYFFESLNSLQFHEPTDEIFRKLLTSAENAVLAFYTIARQSPLIRSISAEFYQKMLEKNKEEFMAMAEGEKLNKFLIESFLLQSSQPAVFTLLYLTFPRVAESDWDKSVAFLIFLRVKSFIDCLSSVYLKNFY